MVEKIEYNRHPNGTEAWIELERTFEGKEIHENPARILALDGKLRNVR